MQKQTNKVTETIVKLNRDDQENEGNETSESTQGGGHIHTCEWRQFRNTILSCILDNKHLNWKYNTMEVYTGNTLYTSSSSEVVTKPEYFRNPMSMTLCTKILHGISTCKYTNPRINLKHLL